MKWETKEKKKYKIHSHSSTRDRAHFDNQLGQLVFLPVNYLVKLFTGETEMRRNLLFVLLKWDYLILAYAVCCVVRSLYFFFFFFSKWKFSSMNCRREFPLNLTKQQIQEKEKRSLFGTYHLRIGTREEANNRQFFCKIKKKLFVWFHQFQFTVRNAREKIIYFIILHTAGSWQRMKRHV